MTQILDYLKRNPEVGTILVPFLAIVGTLFGNYISAKLQAGGGKAQASAARDAARITAEAQRLAALYTDRRQQLALFVKHARDAVHHADQMYGRAVDGDAERAQETYQRLLASSAEVELVAPDELVDLAGVVVSRVEEYQSLAFARAAAARALTEVTAIPRGHSEYRWAHSAYACLRDLRNAYEADDEGEQLAFRSAAASALARVSTVGRDEVDLLLADAAQPALEPIRLAALTGHGRALRALVDATRTVLGADDVQQAQVALPAQRDGILRRLRRPRSTPGAGSR